MIDAPSRAFGVMTEVRGTEDSRPQLSHPDGSEVSTIVDFGSGTVLSTASAMTPKNSLSECLPTSADWSTCLPWCALAMALLCSMDDLRTSKRTSDLGPQEQSTRATWEERQAPWAEGQRIFDSTVRLRLSALLALSATELGQRECSSANPKEPLRGRLDRAVVLAANEQLTLPMGAGSLLTVAGQPYLFCLEPHYHPPGGGITPEGWHKGVTVYRAQDAKERRL